MKLKLFLLVTLFAAFMFTGCKSDDGSGDSNATAPSSS